MGTSITDMQLYENLRQQLGDDKTTALVSFIDAQVKDHLKEMATKEDLRNVQKEIADVKAELSGQIDKAESNIKGWMLGMFITMVGFIIAVLFSPLLRK